MDDLISRQAAIDAVKELCLHYTPTKSVHHPHMDFVIEELANLPSAQLYTEEEIQAMQDLEQAQLDKAYQIGVEECLQSAQPEIVRCKNCKHGMYDMMCKFYWCNGVAHSANWYCADAEGITNE